MASASRTLVFDSSVLSCFARAARLEALRTLTEGHGRVVTRAVMEEIENGIPRFARLDDVRRCGWLEVVRGDSLEELIAFSHYVEILGSGKRNIGEATVLAWAETHSAVAVLYDQAGVNAGKQRGVRVKRTLALVSTGVGRGVLSEGDAQFLVDALIASGARLPCDGRQFMAWCGRNGLLTIGARRRR